MNPSSDELTLRKIGIYVCFFSYKNKHGNFPNTPTELATETASLLTPKRFNIYRDWFLRTYCPEELA